MANSEQIRKRRVNEAALLSELHLGGPLRRGELSQRLGMRKSSVSNIVAEFIGQGVLAEDPPGALRSVLRLRGEGWRTLIGHVEPGCLRVADVSFGGEIEGEQREKIAARARPETILEQVAAMLHARIRGTGKMLTGVGVAIPGITDAAAGRGEHAVNLNAWRGIDVGGVLGQALGCPVAVENDVRCQLLGNAWFGSEVGGCQDAYYLSLQHGVASAALVGGELLLGRRFAAGEIGCLRAGDEGRECRCGKRDCLQTYASADALLDAVNRLRPGAPAASLVELVQMAAGDPSVVTALDRALEPLVPVLATAVSVLDPAAVLLATDDVGFSELLQPLVELRLNRELLGSYTRGVSVLAADNAEDSTLRGMASILIRQAFASGMRSL